jgi:hypothetical protein
VIATGLSQRLPDTLTIPGETLAELRDQIRPPRQLRRESRATTRTESPASSGDGSRRRSTRRRRAQQRASRSHRGDAEFRRRVRASPVSGARRRGSEWTDGGPRPGRFRTTDPLPWWEHGRWEPDPRQAGPGSSERGAPRWPHCWSQRRRDGRTQLVTDHRMAMILAPERSRPMARDLLDPCSAGEMTAHRVSDRTAHRTTIPAWSNLSARDTNGYIVICVYGTINPAI